MNSGTLNIIRTLVYAKKLREAGFTDRQAEVQAEALVEVIDENLATKRDIALIKRDLKELENNLRKDLIIEIEKSKTEIIKWSAGAIFIAVGLFATIIKLIG